jgi:hypothetical protein
MHIYAAITIKMVNRRSHPRQFQAIKPHPKRARKQPMCVHGRQKTTCKPCGGGAICEHKKRRSECVECGGGGICEHLRRRASCTICRGGSVCSHGKRKFNCSICKAGYFRHFSNPNVKAVIPKPRPMIVDDGRLFVCFGSITSFEIKPV